MLLDVRLFTAKEYHFMAEAGILNADERVELLAGQIIKMLAKGTAHSAATTRTEKLLESRLENQALVRVQEPVQLDDYSEPEPDIALVIPDRMYYEDHHPTPSEVYLIIEVADTTLSRDLEFKAGIYARSGIADYWVLDVNNRQLHIFREPSQNGYQSELILSDSGSVSLLAFPNVIITVGEMLRPLS
ncbi:Uma2 family endonuclease [Argonema antarcticum]|uniref:Uma2 family endonuclease n=1 Tax=Argonema antarcticum TaxID=2942763 RepID=UPI002012DC77|nr:Uma2 family endonuclease [Argonema antarcticum]MCL1470752.1 Uma2 family endonuclease [Argonema antarcticum A004/B2]